MSGGGKRMAAAVSVATVWTKPEAPRPLDKPALMNPAALGAWLGAMTVEERLDLCESNRVQTQILYGTSVIVEEEQGDWVKVLIPEQGTRKNAAGYPGWVPRRQLAPEGAEAADAAGSLEEAAVQWKEEAAGTAADLRRADVVADKAWLYRGKAGAEPEDWPDQGLELEPLMELSFLTSLPFLEKRGQWVKVRSPHGDTFLKAAEVRVVEGSDAALKPPDGHIGRGIVEQGKRFLGLPYLWGGMSAYGYDCSGFAYNMHRYFGIALPRDASDQARHGMPVEKERLEPGDLLFFAYVEGKGSIHHVGIYAGDNKMIHSPETISSIEIVDLAAYKLAKEHCVSRRYWG